MTQVPPTLFFSIIQTFFPVDAINLANRTPPEPAPITIKSNLSCITLFYQKMVDKKYFIFFIY